LISCLSFFQVILRNLFSSGFTWADDIIRQGVVWLAIIGGSVAATHSKHISIDILPRMLPYPYKKHLFTFIYLIAIFVSILLLIAALNFFSMLRTSGEIIPALNVSAWYAAIIFPAGMGLITIKFIIRLILNLFNDIEMEAMK